MYTTVCATCGVACESADRFCSQCGSAIALPAAFPVGRSTRRLVDRFPSGGLALDEPMAARLLPGTLLNARYRIVRLLGAGNFGRVYLADDLAGQQPVPVAIKELLLSHFQNDEDRAEAIAWFRREAGTLLALRHPAIPTVHGFWTAHPDMGPMYLVMDYIPGKTLEEILSEVEQDGFAHGCPWRRVVAWGIALSDVLCYLHRQVPPFVFRDLKLANVLLDCRTNSPVLIDFGIARRLTAAGGTVIGTWGYVPIEQVVGQATPRSDIYALGAVLHALLSGRRPDVEYMRLQRGDCGAESAMRVLFPPLDSLVPDLPPALAAIVSCATAFDQRERFSDAAALAGALRAVLEAPHRQPAYLPIGIDAGAPGSPLRPVWSSRVVMSSPYAGLKMRGDADMCADDETGPCLTVYADGTGQFTSIREAIHRAPPRSRIAVGPGLYRESLIIDKPLVIVGRGSVEEIVVEPPSGPCLTMHTMEATVRGLTLRGGPQAEKTAHHVVDIPRGRLLLEDCRIISGARSCLAIHGASTDPIIRRCTIEHGKESGVLLYDTSQCLMEDCEISGNGVGISIRRYACPTIRRCHVHQSASHGIDAEEYAEGKIEESDVVGNGHAGVCIGFGSMLAIHACRINYNERAIVVASNGGGDIHDCDLGANTLGAWSIMPGGEAWLRRTDNWD